MDKPMNLILQTRLRQMQVIYAMAARSEWKPGSVIENSSQGHHCLALPITGSVSLNASDGHFQAGPGRMYCIPPGSKHTYTVDKGGPFRCYWVRFELDAGSTEFFKSLQLPLSAAVDEPDQLEARYRRLISLSGNITDELRARAIIMELVAAYLQRGLEGHSSASVATELSLFSEILDYIERHPADNLSVDDLARQMYLHPNYFISLFRSFTGCTPIQYVNQRKMEHARRLLDESALPVRDIAGEVGLTGPYFSRMFKQLIGTSPRRYRQLMEETRMLRMEKPGEDNHMGSSIKMENPGEDNQADSSIKMENPGEGNQAGSSIKMENPGGDNQAGCSIKMENPGEDNHMGCSIKMENPGEDNHMGCSIKMENPGEDNHMGCSIKMENPGEDNHMGCSIKKGNPDSSSVPGCFPPLNEEFGWLEEAVGCGRTAAIYSIVQRKSGNSFK